MALFTKLSLLLLAYFAKCSTEEVNVSASQKKYMKFPSTPFDIPAAEIHILLGPKENRVFCRMRLQRSSTISSVEPLILDGVNLKLLSFHIDTVSRMDDITVYKDHLKVPESLIPCDSRGLEIETEVTFPTDEDWRKSGLYRHANLFITRNHLFGMRRLTYFLDGPHVYTKFTVFVTVDPTIFPIVLCTGVQKPVVTSRYHQDDRETYNFIQPNRKQFVPSSLQIIAGSFGLFETRWVTMSGRPVSIKVYAEPEKLKLMEYVATVMKEVLDFDEVLLSREYEFPNCTLVAIDRYDDQQTKSHGIFVFDTRHIVISPTTATADEYKYAVAALALQYFEHQESNRIAAGRTPNDSYRDGLAKYFTSLFLQSYYDTPLLSYDPVNSMLTYNTCEGRGDYSSIHPTTKYIFTEPLSSDVRVKDSQIMDIYRQVSTETFFRKAMDFYHVVFKDRARTNYEFNYIYSMALEKNLRKVLNWYDVKTTPTVKVVSERYNKSAKTYTLTLAQDTSNDAHVHQNYDDMENENYPYIPIKIGLIGSDTKKNLLNPATHSIVLESRTQEYTFTDVEETPVLSIFRGAPAYVNLVHSERTDLDRITLLLNDTDLYSKLRCIMELKVKAIAQFLPNKTKQSHPNKIIFADGDQVRRAIRMMYNEALTKDNIQDVNLLSFILEVPDVNDTIRILGGPIDPAVVGDAIYRLVKRIKYKFGSVMPERYTKIVKIIEKSDKSEAKLEQYKRLRDLYLFYSTGDARQVDKALEVYQQSTSLADIQGALNAISQTKTPWDSTFFTAYQEKVQHNKSALVMYHYTMCSGFFESTLSQLNSRYDNPGALKAEDPEILLAIAFGLMKNYNFHDNGGYHYIFLRDIIMTLDETNPTCSIKLVRMFAPLAEFDFARTEKMTDILRSINKAASFELSGVIASLL